MREAWISVPASDVFGCWGCCCRGAGAATVHTFLGGEGSSQPLGGADAALVQRLGSLSCHCLIVVCFFWCFYYFIIILFCSLWLETIGFGNDQHMPAYQYMQICTIVHVRLDRSGLQG